MTDPLKPPAPPVPPAGGPTPPAPGDPPTSPVPPAGDPPPAKSYSQAEYDAALAESRREAAKWRTDHKKLADEKDAADKARMTEEERRAAELTAKEKAADERELKARDRLTDAAISRALVAAGVRADKLDLAEAAIKHSDIEYDDAGEPKNVTALAAALVKKHADLVGTAPAGSGSPDGGTRGGSTLTVEQIKKMSPAEINSRWAEVQQVLGRAN